MPFTYIENAPSISTTEYSLVNNSTTVATSTVQCQAQLVLDLNALAAGDVFLVRLREKARTADTQRIAETWVLSGVQGSPIWCSPAVMLARGWDFTIQRTAGADRTIPYSIRYVT